MKPKLVWMLTRETTLNKETKRNKKFENVLVYHIWHGFAKLHVALSVF